MDNGETIVMESPLSGESNSEDSDVEKKGETSDENSEGNSLEQPEKDRYDPDIESGKDEDEDENKNLRKSLLDDSTKTEVEGEVESYRETEKYRFFLLPFKFCLLECKIFVLERCLVFIIIPMIYFLFTFTIIIRSVVNDSSIPTKLKEDYSKASNNETILFLHLSDIHLGNSGNLNEDEDEFSDFLSYCDSVFTPEFVVVTGDICDSEKHEPLSVTRSNPDEKQWIAYRNVLINNNYFNKSKFIDVRGNHDVYGVRGSYEFRKKDSFYKNNSVWGDIMISSKGIYEFNYKNMSFIASEFLKSVGVKFPLHMYGKNYGSKMKKLKSLIQSKSGVGKRVVLLSHFPTFFIEGITSLGFLKGISLFLNGHTHTPIYLRRNDMIELTVAAYKNGVFRVAVMDKGIFSFVDTDKSEESEILISIPPDANFVTKYDNWENVKSINQIRCFVFSQREIVSVSVSIDNQLITNNMQNEGGNSSLYFHNFDFSSLEEKNFHEIKISSLDEGGSRNEVIRTFSLNGHVRNPTPYPFYITPYYLGAVNVHLSFYNHFFYGYLILLVIIVVFLPKIFALCSFGLFSKMYRKYIDRMFIRRKYNCCIFLYGIFIVPICKLGNSNLFQFFTFFLSTIYVFFLPLGLSVNYSVLPNGKFKPIFFWGEFGNEFELEVISSIFESYFYRVNTLFIFLIGYDKGIRVKLFRNFSNEIGLNKFLEKKGNLLKFLIKIVLVIYAIGGINLIVQIYLIFNAFQHFAFIVPQYGWVNLLLVILFCMMLFSFHFWSMRNVITSVFEECRCSFRKSKNDSASRISDKEEEEKVELKQEEKEEEIEDNAEEEEE